MEEQQLKQVIAQKMAFYRRQIGLTQAELAEKINYSDKSVSKWERAEGIPDVIVLCKLAEIFGVNINELVSDDAPATLPKPQAKKRKHLIPLLSVGLVWLVATIVFFAFKITVPHIEQTYLAFIYAIPASCIIYVVFTCIWFDLLPRFISVSALVWSIASCVYITTSEFAVNMPANMYLIFVVAGVFQVLVALWFWLLHKPGKN